MSNDYRNESRRRPPAERWGTPGTSYPTANPYDLVITEEVDVRTQAFDPLLYGTPHPVVTTALLCHQSQSRGNNTDKSPIRVYANPRLAQEPYNLVHGDNEENNPSYPVFVRSYLLPRGYAPATRLAPLGAIIGLVLTAGGTGYAVSNPTPGFGRISLSVSATGGTGAAGYAEVVAGVIVAVVLTNSGSGYTASGTASATGGSGASITALVQLQTALLTDEVEEPAEEPYGGYFVRVRRTYETIPGPLSSETLYDKESDTNITKTRQLKKRSDITPGATASGTTFILTEMDAIEGDDALAYEVITTIPQATAHDLASAITIGEESLPYQFPGTLNIVKWAATNGLVGYTKPFVRRVPHLTKAFWVASATKPVLSSYVTPPVPGSLFNNFLNGDPIGEVIYDAQDIVVGAVTVHYPGSTPNLTTYQSSWVGVSKPVLGSVREASTRFRWRVEVIFITILVPELPTYS